MKSLGRLRLRWDGGYDGAVRGVTTAGPFLAVARDLRVSTVAFSTRHEGVVALFDRRGRPVASHVEAGVVGARGRLWSTFARKRVIELDPSGRHEIARCPAHGEEIVAIVLGAEGRFVAAWGAHQISVYDTTSRMPVFGTTLGEPIRAAAVDGDDGTVIAATDRELVIARRDGSVIRHPVAQVRAIVRAASGAFLALSRNAMTRLDASGVSGVAALVDGRCLALAGSVLALGTGEGRLELRDPLTLAVSEAIELGQEIAAIAYDVASDAWLVATGDQVRAVGTDASLESLPPIHKQPVPLVPRRLAAHGRRGRWRPALDGLRRTVADAPFLSRLGELDTERQDVVAARGVTEWPGPEDPRAEALVAHLRAIHDILEGDAPAGALDAAAAIDRQVVERLALGPEALDAWHWRRAYQTELVLVARGLALCAARAIDAPADLAEIWSWLTAGHWPCAFASDVDLDRPDERAQLLVV
jgi:hypothetical protein